MPRQPPRRDVDMTYFRYRPRCEQEIARLPGTGRHTLDIAQQVAANVPRHMPGRQRSWPFVARLFTAPLPGGAAMVGTRWKLAHIIEFGSRNNPPYAPLRRAARATGMRFIERPKGSRI